MTNRKKEYDPQILAERIKEALGDRTQKWLAQVTGFSQATMWNYMNGYGNPRCDTLLLLADVLGVSCDYLLGRDGADNE